jgi:hypothetical protein
MHLQVILGLDPHKKLRTSGYKHASFLYGQLGLPFAAVSDAAQDPPHKGQVAD